MKPGNDKAELISTIHSTISVCIHLHCSGQPTHVVRYDDTVVVEKSTEVPR